MKHLPINQVSKSQRRPLQKDIEPNAKIVQADLGCQASLKSRKSMGTFFGQTKGVEQFVKNALDALTQVRQPTSPLFGPFQLASLMWRRDHLSIKLFSPALMRLVTRKPFIGDVAALCLVPSAPQLLVGHGTNSQEGLHQKLIMGTCRTKTIAGDHPFLCDRDQHMEPFIPPNAIAPTNIGLTSQPTRSTPFRISCRNARGIHALIVAVLCIAQCDQMQAEGRYTSSHTFVAIG